MRGIAALLELVCLLAVLAGCACTVSGRQEENSYPLYFQERDLSDAAGRDALRAEETFLPGAREMETQELAGVLVTKLLEGPEDESLQSVFPVRTMLRSLEVREGQAVVDLTYAYGGLSGVELTLADYAVTLTLTELPEISSVSVTVWGKELAYRDRQVFRVEDLLRSSRSDVVSTVTAELYFLDQSGHLTPEERVLDLYEGDTQVGAVTRAVQEGPEHRGLAAVWPQDVQVKAVWLEEGRCYVDYSSQGLPEQAGARELKTASRALSRSLRSLESVEEVVFLVNGTPLPSLQAEGRM